MTKYVRFSAHAETAYGIVEGTQVKQITGTPFGIHEITSISHSLSSIQLLAPVIPKKIVAIGLNYRSHLGDREPPKVPEPFLKTTTSVIGHQDPIIIPKEAREQGVKVQPEAEMAVVIGKNCRRVSKEDALNYVLGYTCGNDVSARDWQSNDLQWWRAKSSDTFSPIGPMIVSDLAPGNLQLTCRINGEIVQKQTTADLLHDVPTIIEFVSSVMTLEVGDVIMTGTPGKPGDITDGDTVEVELEGVGVLLNPVRDE